MTEIWKDINGFVGIYQISNLSNVQSLNRNYVDSIGRNRNVKSKVLSIVIMNTGYKSVDLCFNNVKHKKLIHILLAIAFIPNPENKPTVNHKNGIKLDCTLDNLEWATYGENNKHAIDNGLRKSPWIGITGKDHPISKVVIQYDKNDNYINEFDNSRIAEKLTGISYKHISCCCIGKRKTTGGFKWKYK